MSALLIILLSFYGSEKRFASDFFLCKKRSKKEFLLERVRLFEEYFDPLSNGLLAHIMFQTRDERKRGSILVVGFWARNSPFSPRMRSEYSGQSQKTSCHSKSFSIAIGSS